MQTKSKINWKKLLQGVSLAAVLVTPALGAVSVSQAAPPNHAPAHGYRDNDRDRDNDRNRDNDRDRNNDRDREDRDRDNDRFYDSTRMLEGVVVNDLRGRDFVLRTDNGRNVRVQLDEREPKRLSRNDRVRVQGSFDRTNRNDRDQTRYNENNVFRANDVRIIRDRNNNGNNNGNSNNDLNGRRSLTGIVTDVHSDQRFTLRALNRDFDVSSSSRLPRNISRGNLIRVVGDVRNDNISNADVTIVSNGSGNYIGGNNNNNSNQKDFDFSGTVVESNERNNTLRVRGEDDREYSVRTSEARNWDRGDKVRIKARIQNGVIVAEDIDKR